MYHMSRYTISLKYNNLVCTFMDDKKYLPEEINQECMWSYFISNYIETISFLCCPDYFQNVTQEECD